MKTLNVYIFGSKGKTNDQFDIQEVDGMSLLLNRKSSVMIVKWALSAESTPTCLKTYETELTKINNKFEPVKILFDLSNLSVSNCLNIENWLSKNIFPNCINCGAQKVGFVVEHTIFAKILENALIDEDLIEVKERVFFDNQSKALQWINF